MAQQTDHQEVNVKTQAVFLCLFNLRKRRLAHRCEAFGYRFFMGAHHSTAMSVALI